MYKELDELISSYEKDFESVSEFWSIDGMEDAIDIIREFEEADWLLLANDLNHKSSLWKTLLAQCLVDKENSHIIATLNQLAKTDDKKLFITVINNLSRYDLEQIENKDAIEEKIKEFLPGSSGWEKMNLNHYLRKFESPTS